MTMMMERELVSWMLMTCGFSSWIGAKSLLTQAEQPRAQTVQIDQVFPDDGNKINEESDDNAGDGELINGEVDDSDQAFLDDNQMDIFSGSGDHNQNFLMHILSAADAEVKQQFQSATASSEKKRSLHR